MTDTTDHPLSVEKIMALQLANHDFHSLMRAAYDLGREHEREQSPTEQWEPLGQGDPVRPGDTIERRWAGSGVDSRIVGVAHRQERDGEWRTQEGGLLTYWHGDTFTHRILRAPRPTLPTESPAMIRDVTLDGDTCEVMALNRNGVWNGVDQDGTFQAWDRSDIESRGTWRADRGERDE